MGSVRPERIRGFADPHVFVQVPSLLCADVFRDPEVQQLSVERLTCAHGERRSAALAVEDD
jgi:hypothetical protein